MEGGCEPTGVLGIKLLVHGLVFDLKIKGRVVAHNVHDQTTRLVTDISHVVERHLNGRGECSNHGIRDGSRDEATEPSFGFCLSQLLLYVASYSVCQLDVQHLVGEAEADVSAASEDGGHLSSGDLRVEGGCCVFSHLLLGSRGILRAGGEDENKGSQGNASHDQSAMGNVNAAARRDGAERIRTEDDGAGREGEEGLRENGNDASVAVICVSWRVAILYAA